MSAVRRLLALSFPLVRPQWSCALSGCRLFSVEVSASAGEMEIYFLRIQKGLSGFRKTKWKRNGGGVMCYRTKSVLMVIKIIKSVLNIEYLEQELFLSGLSHLITGISYKRINEAHITGAEIDRQNLLLLWNYICSAYYGNTW